MNRNRNRWTYVLREEVPGKEAGQDSVIEHAIHGRTVSQMDIPEVLRRAGIKACEAAFEQLLTQYSDVMIEVLLRRCVTSHKFGPGPECDFHPSDLTDDEIRGLMLRITRPFKLNLVKAALKYGKGVISDAVTDEELNDLLENGWLTPEEDAAVQAEIFHSRNTGQSNSDAGQGDAQTPARDTGEVL
jgi:hypothetical protein